MDSIPQLVPPIPAGWRAWVLEQLRLNGDHWLGTTELIDEAIAKGVGVRGEQAWVLIPKLMSDLNREGIIERKGARIMTAQWRKRNG